MMWLLAVVTLVSLGCGNIRSGDPELPLAEGLRLPAFPKSGTHAVQIFNEMHYQPSYKSQEGPRLLPPSDSVPVTGRELQYTQEEYGQLLVPEELRSSYDGARAAGLYRINCMVCHGPGLTGNGTIRPFMTRGPFPADLTNPLTQDSSDGDLYAFISEGGRQGYAATARGRESGSPMPEFRLLLSPEERWLLVMYLRSQ
jgi:mono/diheme cytochrome c family protein